MKIKIIIFVLMLMTGFTFLKATPSVPGSTGTVTMPTTPTIDKGDLYIGARYLTGYPTAIINLGYGLTPKWELTGAFESEETDPAPFIHLGTKFNYHQGGSINSSFGVGFINSHGQKESKFSIYNVIGSYAFSGLFSAGIGYTFDETSNINFWMGFSAEIFKDVLYFESDFSNFSYRYFYASFTDAYRGMVNMVLRIKLAKIVTIDFGSLDILDSNRELIAGLQLRFSL